ncbi:MAG: Gfo/Idh/MocA family oxidoreductase [Rhodospirillales bacterium]|jgi:D-apiose dehydrogenase|nr:Gfo/Idh/MocA family oxidoreductase [Rhodospirillales bacterium]
MAEKHLKIGMVGAGVIAQNHLEGWAQSTGADVVAICDPDRTKVAERAGQFGIQHVHGTMEDMLDHHDDLDALDIVTPLPTHVPLVTQCAERGIHAMCQKPLAPSAQEAAQLAAVCRPRIRLMVHENTRFKAHFSAVRAQLRNRAIGEAMMARLTVRSCGYCRAGGNTPWYLDRQPYLADFPQLLIFESIIHHLDALRAIFGDLNVEACLYNTINAGDLSGEDTAIIVLKSGDATNIVLDASFTAAGATSFPSDTLEVLGTDGRIVATNEGMTLFDGDGSQRNQAFASDYQACFSAAIQHFIDQLGNGQPFETEAEDNVKTLALVEQCYGYSGCSSSNDLSLLRI